MSHWNRMESPEINPHIYGQLIYDKELRIHNGEKDGFFNKWCWENWAATYKRIKLGHLYHTEESTQNGLKI